MYLYLRESIQLILTSAMHVYDFHSSDCAYGRDRYRDCVCAGGGGGGGGGEVSYCQTS